MNARSQDAKTLEASGIDPEMFEKFRQFQLQEAKKKVIPKSYNSEGLYAMLKNPQANRRNKKSIAARAIFGGICEKNKLYDLLKPDDDRAVDIAFNDAQEFVDFQEAAIDNCNAWKLGLVADLVGGINSGRIKRYGADLKASTFNFFIFDRNGEFAFIE